MSATQYFSDAAFGGPSWLKWLMFGVILAAIGIGALFFSERARHDPGRHSPRLAWIRAWVYYVVILLISWVTGALGYILEQPLVAPGRLQDSGWLLLVGACWLVAIWGYGYWWPRGTITHGRKLHLLPTLVHGIFWGLSAGLVYLSMYALLEQFAFPGIVNGILLIAVVSVYSLNYQLGWWDIYVSPPHNLRATNNGKVALAHQPFLLVTLALLIIYGDAGMFALLYIFAMTCSAIAMKFPPFWAPDGVPVSRETAMGE
jgi:hypothetical protein